MIGTSLEMPAVRDRKGPTPSDLRCFAPRGAAELATRMQELEGLPVHALRDAWTAAWGAPPPKGARRRFLMLGIAWKWQARVHGMPSRQLEARLAALQSEHRRDGQVSEEALRQGRGLLPGTRLVRDWRGTRHEVQVIEGGFLWQGRRHASLSAIASAITGVRRNGPAFFGLRVSRDG